MKKLCRTSFKFLLLGLLISASLSCKSQKVVLEDGSYFNGLDIQAAYLDQQIEKADPQDSDLLKQLKVEKQDLVLQQNLLAKIKPKPKPSPCGPPNNCPRLVKEMDFLILTGTIKEATLQILNAEDKILTQAKGVLQSASNLQGFSIFKMRFNNNDIDGENRLKVLATDGNDHLSTYVMPLNVN